MSKKIISIHFFNNQVIVQFEKGQIFQFCKACKDGNHLKSFLNYYCPQVDLTLMDKALAQFLEKRFYHHLSHGAVRRVFTYEAHTFADYIQQRYARRVQKKPYSKKNQNKIIQWLRYL